MRWEETKCQFWFYDLMTLVQVDDSKYFPRLRNIPDRILKNQNKLPKSITWSNYVISITLKINDL
jgi:hypothetical protein